MSIGNFLDALDERENSENIADLARLEIALGFKETGLTAMGHYIVDDFAGEIMPEAPIDLQGVLPELVGIWNVTRVEHPLGETLVTSVDAERGEEEG